MFSEMKVIREATDVIALYALVNSYVKGEFVSHAVNLFLEMKTEGCVPDVVTYNSLILGFVRLVNRGSFEAP